MTPTEAQFRQAVIQVAEWCGWFCYGIKRTDLALLLREVCAEGKVSMSDFMREAVMHFVCFNPDVVIEAIGEKAH